MVSKALNFFLCWSKFSQCFRACVGPHSHSVCLASDHFRLIQHQSFPCRPHTSSSVSAKTESLLILSHPPISAPPSPIFLQCCKIRSKPSWVFSSIYPSLALFIPLLLSHQFSPFRLYFSPLGFFFILKWSIALQHAVSRVRGAHKTLLLLDRSGSRPAWSIRISPCMIRNPSGSRLPIWCLIHLDLTKPDPSHDPSGSHPA